MDPQCCQVQNLHFLEVVNSKKQSGGVALDNIDGPCSVYYSYEFCNIFRNCKCKETEVILKQLKQQVCSKYLFILLLLFRGPKAIGKHDSTVLIQCTVGFFFLRSSPSLALAQTAEHHLLSLHWTMLLRPVKLLHL